MRGIGPWQATALNVANMIGVGPFITIPLFLQTMGGPQALVGWLAGAVLVLCDGLVWSELGAALPGSGGTYHYLREIFGRLPGGRLLPFLFIWQFLLSGSLELASGYIGAAGYLDYALPSCSIVSGDRATSEAVPAMAWDRCLTNHRASPATIRAGSRLFLFFCQQFFCQTG